MTRFAKVVILALYTVTGPLLAVAFFLVTWPLIVRQVMSRKRKGEGKGDGDAVDGEREIRRPAFRIEPERQTDSCGTMTPDDWAKVPLFDPTKGGNC